MLKLNPEETTLTGQWLFCNGRMVGDEVELRIEDLIRNHLLKVSDANWRVLFRDPADNRYWQLDFPGGELQGGGPKRLTVISREEALKIFKIDSSN